MRKVSSLRQNISEIQSPQRASDNKARSRPLAKKGYNERKWPAARCKKKVLWRQGEDEDENDDEDDVLGRKHPSPSIPLHEPENIQQPTFNIQRPMSGDATPSRPHPGPNLGLAPLPCPREREKLLPHLCDWPALDLRRFGGSMRECFGKFSPLRERGFKKESFGLHHPSPSVHLPVEGRGKPGEFDFGRICICCAVGISSYSLILQIFNFSTTRWARERFRATSFSKSHCNLCPKAENNWRVAKGRALAVCKNAMMASGCSGPTTSTPNP